MSDTTLVIVQSIHKLQLFAMLWFVGLFVFRCCCCRCCYFGNGGNVDVLSFDNRFVIFSSEADARLGLEHIRNAVLDGKALKARLKTESLTKSFYQQ